MSNRKVWQKFNFREWRSDESLRRCSREAQAVWLDLCGLIYEAADRGRLSVAEGAGRRPYTQRELCGLLGDDPRVMRRVLLELQNHHVFDLDADGFIVSRRILREELRAQLDQSNGQLGGNPSLKDKALAETPVNPPVKAKMPEKKEDSEAKASGADAPLSIRSQIWAVGRPMFETAHVTKAAAGSVIGALIKRKGEIEALAIITKMRADPPMDPESYLWRVVHGRAETAEDSGAPPQLELVMEGGKPVMRPIARVAA